MLTMGGDFCYQNAQKYFKNLDILMDYVNANTTNNGFKMIYSTPSQYMDAVLKSIGMVYIVSFRTPLSMLILLRDSFLRASYYCLTRPRDHYSRRRTTKQDGRSVPVRGRTPLLLDRLLHLPPHPEGVCPGL